MYCPYCGVDHDATVVESVEHIIPYGLGGSDALTILTCDKANNDLGSSVDAPFMDFFPIQAKRFFLGLESTKGNAPVLDLGGIGWIDGKETLISYLIAGESKELKVGKPTVVKTPGDNGQERWQVSGDPAKVMEILKGKVRKQMALGKTVTLEDGTLLFGEIGGMIPLAPLPADRLPTLSDKGKVWRIALPSRELTTFSIPELVVERMKVLRGDEPSAATSPSGLDWKYGREANHGVRGNDTGF